MITEAVRLLIPKEPDNFLFFPITPGPKYTAVQTYGLSLVLSFLAGIIGFRQGNAVRICRCLILHFLLKTYLLFSSFNCYTLYATINFTYNTYNNKYYNFLKLFA